MSYSGGVEYQLEVCYFLAQMFSELSTSDQLCEYLGQRSSNVEDLSLLRYEAVKIGLYVCTFRRNLLPTTSG